jgi:Immunity protein 42
MIIGDKNRFAIEFEICNLWGKMQDGKIILFINNSQIGSYDDNVYLNIPCEGLLSIIDSGNILYPEFRNKKPSVVMKIFNTSFEEKYDSCLLHFGESFDDFLFRAYKVNPDKICFLWKLAKNHFFEYPKCDFRSKSFELDISEVRFVVEQFREMIAPYNPSLQ